MTDDIRGAAVDEVTVVIPFLKGGNEEWLQEAINGFPQGQRYIVVENDGEMAQALNETIEHHVETEWVYRFDADDVPGTHLVERLYDALWDGSDVAYPTMVLTDEDLKPLSVFHADPFCRHRIELMNFVSGCTLFRRSTFLEVGGYHDLEALEDWDLWLRMARAGARFKPVPEAYFFYRQVKESRNRQLEVVQVADLHERIRGPEPMKDAKATFYFQGTPMVAQIRCVNPARWLPGVANPIYFIAAEDHQEQPKLRFPLHRGAAVFQFAGTQNDALKAKWMQLNGFPVFVETDDNYTVTGGRVARRAGWTKYVGEAGNEKDMPSVEGHIRIVRSADGVIVTTEYLREQYLPFNDNVWVCPNQVEPSEWPTSPLNPDDGVIRIGWFASGSHDRDYPLIAKAMRWASKQKNVEVVTMGIDVDDAELVNHRVLPWCDDWGVYRLMVGMLDIGLAPIAATTWSLGRSDLKALDYAMGAALPILQDDRPYDSWQHGVNCLKAKTPDDWLKVVKYAVYQSERRKELAAEARRYTLEERTYEGNAWRWAEAVASAERKAIAA